MTSFSKLQRFKVSSQTTTRYDLGIALHKVVEGEEVKTAVLILAPATSENAELLNHVLREGARRQREEAALQKGRRQRTQQRPEPPKSVDRQLLDLAEGRDKDAETFAKFVVKGWENVFDDDGKESPFSEENCLAFLRSLPPEMFDEVRAYSRDNVNFMPAEVYSVAKN